jgi:hypothetical protein
MNKKLKNYPNMLGFEEPFIQKLAIGNDRLLLTLATFLPRWIGRTRTQAADATRTRMDREKR